VSETLTPVADPGLSAEGFVSVLQAAKFLSLSRSTLYALMDVGQIPFARFGRSRRVPKKALAEYAERSIVNGASGNNQTNGGNAKPATSRRKSR
jgi:excisionase family DNA binding protein